MYFVVIEGLFLFLKFRIWRCSPLFAGVGISVLIIVTFDLVYYPVVVSYDLVYAAFSLISIFTNEVPPWHNCGKCKETWVNLSISSNHIFFLDMEWSRELPHCRLSNETVAQNIDIPGQI